MGAPPFISSIDLHQGVPSMAFPRSLNAREITEYIAYYFEWDLLGVAFPSLPLPNDFQALCPSYELAVADDAARHFELPELPKSSSTRCFLMKRRGWGSCMGGHSA